MNQNVMIECIRDESNIVREILKNKEYYTNEIVAHFKKNTVKRVYITGHGSPYNVGGVLRLMMENLLQVEVSVDYASMFYHHLSFNANGNYKPEEMLLICPAQSGKTCGPVNIARRAQKKGIPVLCTTLHSDGILATHSDIVMIKHSGIEKSFPETKGHVASLAILMIAILEIAKALQKITMELYEQYEKALQELPQQISSIIQISEQWYKKNNTMLLDASSLIFIGSGEHYATAIEGSLKILETTLKACLSYECEEFMHGQNQPVDENSIIFMIACKGSELERIHTLASWCREKKARVIVIGQQQDTTLLDCDMAIPDMDCPYISSIPYLIPFQVISYYMAKDMGYSDVIAHHDDAGKELGVRYE